MREFFRGWRRKVGCITLVMACLCMAGWIRSTVVCDLFYIKLGMETSLTIESASGCFTVDWTNAGSLRLPFWMTSELPGTGGLELWDWKVGPFGYMYEHDQQKVIIVMTGPYWFTTIPLTLLSAYVLLWKPRKRPCPNQLVSTQLCIAFIVAITTNCPK